jgi:hypothetical protein
MIQRLCAGVVLAVGGVVSTGVCESSAPAAAGALVPASEVEALRAEVAVLRSQVQSLQSESGDQWLTERRAQELRGLVQDVLADAETRASLLQSGMTAGWDKGFFIASSDGNYKLQIAGQLQFRAVYNNQDDGDGDNNRFGFETRRTKIDFKGHVVDKTWQYYIEAEASRSSPGSFSLAENGWMQKDLGNGFKIMFGQFKPKFLREEGISSRRLQGVERSQVNTKFSAGTSQGVQAIYEQEKFRLFGAFIDGAGTSNTAWSVEDTEYAFTGRGEVVLIGDLPSTADDIGFRDMQTALLLGGGVLWQRAEFGTGSNQPAPDFNNSELETLTVTGDITFKTGGGSIAGAVIYRMLDTDATGAEADQVAFVARGGFFVTDDIELYGMYEWGDLDTSGVEDLSVLTVGVTKYFAKHDLKWQSDIGFGFNEVQSDWAVDSAGWRADGVDQDGQLVIRSQFQLLF